MGSTLRCVPPCPPNPHSPRRAADERLHVWAVRESTWNSTPGTGSEANVTPQPRSPHWHGHGVRAMVWTSAQIPLARSVIAPSGWRKTSRKDEISIGTATACGPGSCAVGTSQHLTLTVLRLVPLQRRLLCRCSDPP